MTDLRAACPECGTGLSGETWSPGLCPRCSLLLALDVGYEPVGSTDIERRLEKATESKQLAAPQEDGPELPQ